MSYWDRITEIYLKQKEKGIKTYGQTLEKNTSVSPVDRITMLQEELVDGLLYCEHIKTMLIEKEDDLK